MKLLSATLSCRQKFHRVYRAANRDHTDIIIWHYDTDAFEP